MAKKQAAKKSAMSDKQKLVVGVGLTAAAVTAAGVYFLQGSNNAPKNRKKVKSWMLHAKAEVLEKLEDAQEMTQDEFEDLVSGVSATYSKLKGASVSDIASFKREMKEHWPKIAKEGKTITAAVGSMAAAMHKKPAKKAAKKSAAKKTTKKATKKAAKKAAKKTTKKTAKKVAKK